MFRKSLFGVIATLALGLVAVGCSDDSSDGSSGHRFIVVTLFPGTAVSASFVADDHRALSQHDTDVDGAGDITCFWSTQENAMILVIRSFTGVGNLQTHVSYRNSSGTFTPPVQVYIENEAAGTAPTVVGVVWLNTSGFSSGAAAADAIASARNGDALLFFTARQDGLAHIVVGGGNQTPTQPTTGLFQGYFNRDLVATKSVDTGNGAVLTDVLTWRYGFLAELRRVDDDPDDATQPAGGATVGNEASVGDPGIVSDSISGTYGTNMGAFGYECSGDATSFVYAQWNQNTAPDSTAINGLRRLYKQFPMTTDTFTFAAGAATALPTGGLTSTIGGTAAVFDGHNNWHMGENGVLLTHWDAAAGGALGSNTSDDDDALVANVFNSTTVDAGDQLSRTGNTNGTIDVNTNNVWMYGEDMCISGRHYIGFAETGSTNEVATAAAGDRNPGTDLMLASVSVTGTIGLEGAAVELDEFSTNGAAPDTAGISVNVQAGFQSRNGQLVTVIYSQNTDNDTGTNTNVPLKAVCFETTRAVNDAVVPFSATIDVTASGDPANQDNAQFINTQDDAGECFCGIQGDWTRMNLLYREIADTGSVDPLAELHIVGVRATVSATGAAAPTLATVGEAVVDTQRLNTGAANPGIVDDRFAQAVAFDAGVDNGGTTDGACGVVYERQISNATGAATNGNFVEWGLYLWNAGTTLLVSTDGFNDEEQVGNGTQRIEVTPVPTALVPANSNGGDFIGTQVHLFYSQARNAADRSAMLYHHALIKDLPATTGFSTTSSILISRDTGNSAGVIGGLRTLVGSGNTVDVYFDQGGNLWWQQWNGTSWLVKEGTECPELVDTHYQELVSWWTVCEPCHNGCESATDTAVFWGKVLNDGNSGGAQNDHHRLLHSMR